MSVWRKELVESVLWIIMLTMAIMFWKHLMMYSQNAQPPKKLFTSVFRYQDIEYPTVCPQVLQIQLWGMFQCINKFVEADSNIANMQLWYIFQVCKTIIL